MKFNRWSIWSDLPNPLKGEFLSVPISPGVYQIRNKITGEFVLFGRGGNVANRFCSLYPKNLYGKGNRRNTKKIEYIGQHMTDLEYRIMPTESIEDAISEEKKVKGEYQHIFEPTR